MNSLLAHETIIKLLANNSLSATDFANWISGYETVADSSAGNESAQPQN